MKKTFAFVVFILALCGFAFAKSPFAEFEKAREIKLLQSNRDDVKRILAAYEYDDSEDEDYEQFFSTENAEIEISFSRGDCSDDSETWKVAEWTVTKIEVSPENAIKVEDIKFDFSNYTKETEDEEFPESYVYHNENSGIVFKIDNSEIQKIILFPAKNNRALLCESEKTREISSNEKRLVDFILKEDRVCILINKPPTVDNVILSATEIIGCSSGAQNKSCAGSNRNISVTTATSDAENDVLTYLYEVSGGRIIGQGAKVVWDLTGVEAGTYTITVGADDGCGDCSPRKTETVVVKDRPLNKLF